MVAISLLAAAVAMVLPAARADFPGFPKWCPLPPVDNVDLTRFTGRWYEIGVSAIIRYTVESKCKCTEARYSLNTNTSVIHVQNVCAKKNENVVETIYGTAKVLPSKTRSSDIGVSFIIGEPANSVNYIPVKIFGDYEQVLVGTPCFLVMWVLSRTPTVSDQRYDEIMKYARKVGFRPKLIGFSRTDQQCDFRGIYFPEVPIKTFSAA